MKYFRSYPWGMQLLLFLLMIVTMLSFCTAMVYILLPKFSPFSLEQLTSVDEHSPAQLIRTSLVAQGIFSLFIFLIPSLLFAYLTHPRPAAYLGLKPPGKQIQILLAILIMVGADPMLQGLQGLISQIDFGAKLKAEQIKNDNMMSAFLNMPDFTSFLIAFLVMSIIPALGEEMFFRGLLLRLAKKRSQTMTFPIIFTAAVFAYSHTNIYGLLSIFFAGLLLAVIYNLTGSLWCSIAGHLSFNGLQVILAYAGNSSAPVKAFMDQNTVPLFLIIAGAIVFGISFYLLWKNKTPLPPDWTDDFSPDELSQKDY